MGFPRVGAYKNKKSLKVNRKHTRGGFKFFLNLRLMHYEITWPLGAPSSGLEWPELDGIYCLFFCGT